MDYYKDKQFFLSVIPARLLVMAHDEQGPMTKGSHQARG
jgi:hypothetical protein